jgi:hypothetical protein
MTREAARVAGGSQEGFSGALRPLSSLPDGPSTPLRALQAWLGHRNIQHTVRYAELTPDRFKNFWR